ncbi:response regulator [Enterovibrio coralii]|uniref:Two-component system response regulator n=1 Tax=Enterovibrio coralii TaxID=294935 RepID=A0A135IAF0_9GAMM|nr:response regulator [Enterovibrio coralii]KXF82435.1 two-component system response regulator [Enterovibrio coralii]
MLDKCLIVDDHEMIRETIAIMAKSLGFEEAITAIDGADAISKLYHERPSLIITDLQMDPIDGLEMLRLVRSGRFGLPHDIPIIILTANASESVIAQCIAFDVDAFLVKPVNRQSLQERVNQLAQQAKPKKTIEHYFEIYQQDPAKTTAFQTNGTIAFADEAMEEFESLVHESAPLSDIPTVSEPVATTDTKQDVEIAPPKKLFIKWQDRFSVGQSDLDNSNMALLDIINDTYDIIINHKDEKAFDEIAARFDAYIKGHILLEEQLLEQREYQRLKVHKEMHVRLVKQADFVILKCQADPSFYKTDFFKLLRFWWVKHVVQEDTKYKNVFLEHA